MDSPDRSPIHETGQVLEVSSFLINDSPRKGRSPFAAALTPHFHLCRVPPLFYPPPIWLSEGMGLANRSPYCPRRNFPPFSAYFAASLLCSNHPSPFFSGHNWRRTKVSLCSPEVIKAEGRGRRFLTLHVEPAY